MTTKRPRREELSLQANAELYLYLGGWTENSNGWWHAPYCLASFPLLDALNMARSDEQNGLRMGLDELMEYHSELGGIVRDRAEYEQLAANLLATFGVETTKGLT